MKLEEMSLADLVTAQKILEEKIESLIDARDAYRGKNYVEFERREELYLNSPYHDQLEKIEKQIENIINSI